MWREGVEDEPEDVEGGPVASEDRRVSSGERGKVGLREDEERPRERGESGELLLGLKGERGEEFVLELRLSGGEPVEWRRGELWGETEGLEEGSEAGIDCVESERWCIAGAGGSGGRCSSSKLDMLTRDACCGPGPV